MTEPNLLQDNMTADTQNKPNKNSDAVTLDTLAPNGIPAKFWDVQKKEIRTDALLQSYLALEKKMNSSIDANDPEKLRRAIGVPEKPDDYCVKCDHGLFEPSSAINQKLHENGFSPEQAQLVYDLAAEHLVPLIIDVAEQFQANHEQERLVEAFGGQDKWREVSRQMTAWGETHLPEQALKGLAASYEGVMALYKMMQNQDPAMTKNEGKTGMDEAELHHMMQDPRYWQKKDPSFVKQVTEGFRQIYSN